MSETATARWGPSSPPTQHSVPFFTQAASFEARWPSIARHIEDVIDNGKYSHGRKVVEFEEAMAAYTGARHAIAVNSGTDALIIALRAAGLRAGDGVVVPAFSFIASASSVVLARCRPRFADIDPISYSIAPDSAAAAVDQDTRAIMPVHLFCQLADMSTVMELAERHDLTVVEDSAEAIGMRWDGRHAGLLGRAGVLSFFPTAGVAADTVPWYFVLFLVPVLLLRARQLGAGLPRNDPLVARKLGIKIHRLGSSYCWRPTWPSSPFPEPLEHV